MKSNKLSFLNSLIYGSFWVICTLIFSTILSMFTFLPSIFRELASGILTTKIIFYMIPKKFEKKDKKPPFIKDILFSLANVIIVRVVSLVTSFIVVILAAFYKDSEIFSLITNVDMDINHNPPEFLLLSLIVYILNIPFMSLRTRFYINEYVLK